MNKRYNDATKTDMPLDSSLTPDVTPKITKDTQKSKINVLGKKPTGTKSSTSKSSRPAAAKPKATSSKAESKDSSSNLRKKLAADSVDSQDLEQLNEENIKSHRFRSRRNQVIIIVLSLLLVIAVAAIGIFLGMNNVTSNCFMKIHGEVNAVTMLKNAKTGNYEEMTDFRLMANLRGTTVILNLKLNIKSGGKYKIKFTPKAYQKNELMFNTLIYEHNYDLFYDGYDGYFYSYDAIDGGQTIDLCTGVALDPQYANTLNLDNFKLEMHIYFDKVT